MLCFPGLKGATALSQAVITGGAVTSVAYGLSKRHPTLDKPLVDFNLALVLTPMMLLGVSSGEERSPTEILDKVFGVL